MDSGRLMIDSAAAPFCAAGGGGGGGQVMLFGGGIRGAPMAPAGTENGRRKRPFLTAHEELHQLELGMDIMVDVDQLRGFEYELHQGAPERTKRRLTAEQVRALEVSFEEEKRKLEPERKTELARRLGIAPRQVAVWFQNRRARWRTKQLEQDFDCLRAAHGELLACRDALAADNDRLRSQGVQAKEPPATQPEEQAAPSSTATDTTAVEAAVLFVQLDDDQLWETSGGAVPTQGLVGGANTGSPESYSAVAPSPPSSSDGDCGDEGSALFLPDAMLLAALEHGSGLDAAQDSWEWFWN